MPDDLWGELPAADNRRTPRDVLTEQAGLLTNKTRGKLEGRVRQRLGVKRSEKSDIYTFEINVPANSYTFGVCTIEFDPISLYPAKLYDKVKGKGCEISDENDFKEKLGEVFQSNEMREVMAALLRMSEE
ncbi:hypothetical protein GC197_14940 [bacterium]|nr:hypothetical protein [bacterium]